MFGLDDQIANLGAGEAFLVVAIVAILLGLRHATDPDHLTAVSTLVAGDRADTRGAGRLGLAWGLGHATTLFAFGLPIVLYRSYLPETLQTAAETLIGLVIVALAARLLLRWRESRRGADRHLHAARSPLQAYGIGLVHGIGGSAGVGVLLLASIPDHVEAVAALGLFAAFTAVSMSLASTSFGWVLSRGAVQRSFVSVAPALGALSLAFGVWYSLGAVQAVPYVF
jgi:High-affinity nickel-transport protein